MNFDPNRQQAYESSIQNLRHLLCNGSQSLLAAQISHMSGKIKKMQN
jgi:hypothetical protein